MKAWRRVILAAWFGLFLYLTGCAGPGGIAMKDTALDPDVLKFIGNAVYEVVVPKPAKDSLQYEKPLPMDLLPYSVRTDEYYSLGTAFAVGPSEFVSAAHVFNLGSGSQFKEFFLRDKEKKVYPVDKILKYSKNRDFIVFSLRNATAGKSLPVNEKPQLNQKVYAVGNALGEGIVIRDGLYTSDTPEEEEGEWNWIRFSAAASPGNSGGPLLDPKGNVIGIVLRKSPNENLNFAVPISEVMKAKRDLAVLQTKERYLLDNMDMTKRDTLKKESGLPKTCQELDKEINTMMTQFSNKLLKDLLAENRDNIFPRGAGSIRLLYKSYNAVFPNLIIKGKDGNWDAYYPRETREADLGNNGRIVSGNLAGSTFMYIHKPDDIAPDKFYGDSKLFMDLILKAGGRSREIGPEDIKVTSMGSASEDYRFTDSYGRIWVVRTWLIEYNDTKVVTFSLPVPGGWVVIMRTDETGNIDQGHIPDLKVLSDFIYLSYYGTFKEWREFLIRKDLLPPIFSTLDIQVQKNKEFRYKSKRLSLSCEPEMMKISDHSELKLDFSYFQDHGKVIWDIGNVSIGEEKFNQTGYSVTRMMKPPKEMGEQYQSNWEDMAEKKFPYNHSAYHKDKVTIISAIYDKNNKSGKGNLSSNSVLYSIGFIQEGKIEQKPMESKLERFMKNLTVYENMKAEGDIKNNPPMKE